MNRVFINPVITGQDQADGGIRRVVEAQQKYLPEFDWVVSNDPYSADLIVNHGTLLQERPGVPMIAACHGLYWHDYDWPHWHTDANKRVIEVMARADHITVPSQWVKGAITRGMLRTPTVVQHGIDVADWAPAECYGFGLWNKARTDPVSDETVLDKIAAMLPNVPFVTTFGKPARNVRVTGNMPYGDMKDLVPHAGFYLGTVRETFGIGFLEAFACGVPVVGWDFGGQRELVRNGINGELVPVGNYDALAEAILKVLNNRAQYSQGALDFVRQDRWAWRTKVGEYANVFNWVLGRRRSLDQGVKVSVIITCHNLGRYLEAAVQSVVNQTMPDWECIIVDDASTDDTPAVALRCAQMSSGSQSIRSIRVPENMGLSMARNVGFYSSEGKYIIHLDADDMLDRSALARLADALDQDTSIHIAFGGLDVMDEHGSERRENDWPKQSFDWWDQMAHLNQVPYSALMRRSVLEASGGYRQRHWRAEDASFWTRVTSLGFRARRVTDRATLVYRMRSGSKGGQERDRYQDVDGDWTAEFPWRAGARSGEEGAALPQEDIRKRVNPRLVPFGAQGPPPKGMESWHVRHHSQPAVSVIIPVGPGHERYLVDALDSLVAQTCPSWEAIVVDDTGRGPWQKLNCSGIGHPHARVVSTLATNYYTGKPGSVGSGMARNIGVKEAIGEFILFLDADDMLAPKAIEDMLRAYVDGGGGYVYTDCLAMESFAKLGVAGEAPGELLEAPDYDQMAFLGAGYYESTPGLHSVTMLMTVSDFWDIGGFDTQIKYWEDWKLALQAAVKGLRGIHVPKPHLWYRYSTGTRRRGSFEDERQLWEVLRVQFEPYLKGEKEVCSCGGGTGGARAATTALMALEDMRYEIAEALQVDPMTLNLNEVTEVKLQYIGTRFGAIPYRGPVSKRKYRFGLEPGFDTDMVDPRDLPHFMKMSGQFRIIEAPKTA